jgi:hypothetical protein
MDSSKGKDVVKGKIFGNTHIIENIRLTKNISKKPKGKSAFSLLPKKPKVH